MLESRGAEGLGQESGPVLLRVGGGPPRPQGRIAQPPSTICGVQSFSGLAQLTWLAGAWAPATLSPGLLPPPSAISHPANHYQPWDLAAHLVWEWPEV